MQFEILPQSENITTKPLYEQVFSEDQGPFADYYYDHVAPHSTIYIARDGAGIHSMIHLNPCRLWWNGELIEIPYLVAVATEEPYRHRGLMRSLLEKIFHDLERQHVPFAFLMPVNEAIYAPFGFQRTWSWTWEEDAVNAAHAAGFLRIPAQNVRDETLQKLCDHVNGLLQEKYEIFTWRTVDYYRRLDLEQRASAADGRLEILFQGEVPVAAVQTARDHYPAMMCRVMDEEAYRKRLLSESDRPFEHACVSEVV